MITMQLKLFNSPSILWPIIVIPLILLLFILNMISLIAFIKVGFLTQQDKFIFSIKIILMMAVSYVLLGYYYQRWASAMKNELLETARENRNILYEKYGRILVDKDICQKTGHNPLPFRRLSQSDLREVINYLSWCLQIHIGKMIYI